MELVDLLVDEMEEAGIKLTLIAAPLPEFMLGAMSRSGHYTYLSEWRAQMKKRHANFFDYTSVASFPGDDCEFLDYYHGGEVTYMRVMWDIGRKKKGALHNLIDVGRLENLISERAGDLIVADNSIGVKLLGPGAGVRYEDCSPPGR